MSQIDELQKRYPSIPRDVIIKHNVLVRGIRDSDDLDKISSWRSVENAYASYDYDVTLKDIATKTPWRARPGSMLRPNELMLKSGLGTYVRLRSSSTYTVREVSEGNFAIFEGEEEVEAVHVLRREPRATPEPVTSKGTPISRLISSPRPTCFFFSPVRYCEFFGLGEQCKFCNFNATHEDGRAAGLDIPVSINLEEALEAYKIRSSEVRLFEGHVVMGGFANVGHDVKIHLGFLEKIAGAASYKPNLTIRTPAMSRMNMQRLKDVGLNCVIFQIEVLDPKLFAEICPGKAKYTPYERWIEAFHNAVEIFGVGNVGGKLIPGVTLLPPNGHKTWQEARDYHIEANNWLIKNGVAPWFYAMWWAPGSKYEDRSYVNKFPPTEYHLEVGLAHHKAMLEYGLYKKINKFLYCAFDCVNGPYGGEIGMIALAGDLGKWMADVVPDEANWLAKLIASVKTPAQRSNEVVD